MITFKYAWDELTYSQGKKTFRKTNKKVVRRRSLREEDRHSF